MLGLNRRKSRAPPPTQPSFIFKVALKVEPDTKDLQLKISVRLKINDGRGSLTAIVEVFTVPSLKLSNATVVKVGLH